MAQPAFQIRENVEGRSRLEQLAEDILLRCRGEGPPNCVARCPLGVDARGYVQLTKEGKFREALQLVREKLPFPGILGYICAAPCEWYCKKIDEDEPIRIREIKRFLVDWEQGEPQHITDKKPDTGKSVAVVGGGPAGLLAACDLAKGGYNVTIYEKHEQLGGALRYKIPPWRLPREVLDRDLSVIQALGVEVKAGTEIGRDVSLADLRAAHDAVLLMVGFEGVKSMLGSELKPSFRGTLKVDPITCETGLAGVFAAGEAISGPGAAVFAMALGRRAAESAVRYLEGRDLREGRDLPVPHRLLWTLEIDEEERRKRQRLPLMLEPIGPGLSQEEAVAEAERCLNCECGLCVADCEFLKKHCNSPKELARKVLQRLDEPETLKMVYSCNVCQLCQTVCPENLDTGALLMEARREAVRRGKGPLPEHKGIISYFNAGVSKTFTLAMAEPGRSRSKRLFFTGCALPSVAPRHTVEIYDQLRRHYPGTGVLMYCCGAPVELLGMEKEFHSAIDSIRQIMDQLGAEELVTACPDCTHTLMEAMPDIKIVTAWELLADSWSPSTSREGEVISIHDSCKARHMDGLHKAVRKLLEASGCRIEEIEYRCELARCCGFGGMIYPVDTELSQAVSRLRAGESPHPMVTYCAGCRMALAGVGKESIHILDFLLGGEWRKKAAAKPPGSISRYLNRLKTKWSFKRLKPIRNR